MRYPLILTTAALFAAGSAFATPVTLGATVLTLSTPGVLTLSTDGTELSSSAGSGVKAVLAVVSTGTAPTLSFTAPSLTGPTGSTSGATKTLAYSSPGGASQAATAGSYAYAANRLLDTVTIDGRAVNAQGFGTGVYTIGTTATCQQ